MYISIHILPGSPGTVPATAISESVESSSWTQLMDPWTQPVGLQF